MQRIVSIFLRTPSFYTVSDGIYSGALFEKIRTPAKKRTLAAIRGSDVLYAASIPAIIGAILFDSDCIDCVIPKILPCMLVGTLSEMIAMVLG